jgi:hypothetical protein
MGLMRIVMKNRFMFKAVFIILLIFSVTISAQEKELKAGPTQYKGGEPDFYMFPGRAALIVYSSLNNLYFECTTDSIIGPVYEVEEKRYTILFDTHPQVIEVKCPGYKSAIITTPALQPSDVVPYSVEPKLGENDPGMITVQFTVTPTDADFFVDFKKVDPTIPLKLSPGNHKIKIVKEGHPTFKQEIFVDESHYQFVFRLE